ncbi:MAG: hypothetical protein ACC707_10085 [Thiohalomonadales bacterium]
MKLKKIFVGVLGVTLMSASMMSFALDAKTVAGAACQEGRSSDNTIRPSDGSMLNNFILPQEWTCPIVRDLMESRIVGARIEAVNRNGTMSCSLNSRDSRGGFVSILSKSLTLSGNTVQRMEWENGIDAGNYGYYYFRCRVNGKQPRTSNKSGIVSYYWVERN